MSNLNTVKLTSSLVLTGQNGSGTGSTFAPSSFAYTFASLLGLNLGNGTGADNSDQIYLAQANLAASANTTLNLNTFGGALDVTGTAYSQVTVKGMAWQILGNALAYQATSAVVGSSGGTSGTYVVGDIITVYGGTLAPGQSATTLKVLQVSGNQIASGSSALSIVNNGIYTVAPSLTNNATTGGSGAGALINLTMPSFTLSAAQMAAGLAVYTESDYLNFGNATNPMIMPWGTTGLFKQFSGTFKNPGQAFFASGGATGYVVTPSTAMNLKIANGGANNITYNIVIIGATA